MERYYLVRQDILPEALIKTIHAKDLLVRGEAATVQEAVDKAGLSRSAFYKYKDGIHPLDKLEREQIVTISMDLQHKTGILSKVLALMAEVDGNVLTINQTIPLQGQANVVLTVDTSKMGDRIGDVIRSLNGMEGVNRAMIIGRG